MLAMFWVPLFLLFVLLLGVLTLGSFIASCAMVISFSVNRNWSVLKVLLTIALALPAPALGLVAIFAPIWENEDYNTEVVNNPPMPGQDSGQALPVYDLSNPIDSDEATKISYDELQLWKDVQPDPLKPTEFEVPPAFPIEQE